jgi:hypothetical protein
MAAARQGLPVRLHRAPQRGAAFALTSASRRARSRSIGSRSRARGSLLIFDHPPPSLPRLIPLVAFPLLLLVTLSSPPAFAAQYSCRRELCIDRSGCRRNIHPRCALRVHSATSRSSAIGDHPLLDRERHRAEGLDPGFQGRAWFVVVGVDRPTWVASRLSTASDSPCSTIRRQRTGALELPPPDVAAISTIDLAKPRGRGHPQVGSCPSQAGSARATASRAEGGESWRVIRSSAGLSSEATRCACEGVDRPYYKVAVPHNDSAKHGLNMMHVKQLIADYLG